MFQRPSRLSRPRLFRLTGRPGATRIRPDPFSLNPLLTSSPHLQAGDTYGDGRYPCSPRTMGLAAHRGHS